MSEHDEIERRAYELYEARGRADGHDRDDWFQAEHELQQSTQSASVNVSGARRRRRDSRSSEVLAATA